VSFRAEGPVEHEGALVWDVEIDPAWRAFAGHFPGRPVLPAIGHLFVVATLLADRQGTEVSITEIDRLRVVRPILPGARLRVRLELRGPDEASRAWISEDAQLASEARFRWIG
jgi:3-hydroxymyristoyl/3-hydroxydecanoyl-(acyl carrier protein) dehydratase